MIFGIIITSLFVYALIDLLVRIVKGDFLENFQGEGKDTHNE